MTKQRDLEGGQTYSFTLKHVRIGTNNRDKAIVSCVVHSVPTSTVDRRRQKLSDNSAEALRELENVIAEYGQMLAVTTKSSPEMVVLGDRWKAQMWNVWATSKDNIQDNRNSFNTAFRRAVNDLKKRGIVRVHQPYVHLISQARYEARTAGGHGWDNDSDKGWE